MDALVSKIARNGGRRLHAKVTLNAARLEHGQALEGYGSLLALKRDALVVLREGHLVELFHSRLEGMTDHGEVACRRRGAELGLNEHNDPREHSRREVTKRKSERHIRWGTERQLGAEVTEHFNR